MKRINEDRRVSGSLQIMTMMDMKTKEPFQVSKEFD